MCSYSIIFMLYQPRLCGYKLQVLDTITNYKLLQITSIKHNFFILWIQKSKLLPPWDRQTGGWSFAFLSSPHWPSAWFIAMHLPISDTCYQVHIHILFCTETSPEQVYSHIYVKALYIFPWRANSRVWEKGSGTGSGRWNQDLTLVVDPNPVPGQSRAVPSCLDLYFRFSWCKCE